MNNNRRTCWFPLPTHHPQVALLRQGMFLRHTSISIQPLASVPPNTVLYTDGSCDDTRDPYTARAAWSVVIRTPHPETHQLQVFQVLACGHCPGHQSINRSELFAMVIAVEQVLSCSAPQPVTFVTDSQFVADILHAINSGTIWRHPHKQAHWNLIQRLLELWDTSNFFVFKIKSHQTLSDAHNQFEAWHIHGNACADEAAGQARLTDDPTFSTLCQEARAHRLQESNICDKIHAYLIDLALTRMLKTEEQRCPDVSGTAPAGMQSASAHTAYLISQTNAKKTPNMGSSGPSFRTPS